MQRDRVAFTDPDYDDSEVTQPEDLATHAAIGRITGIDLLRTHVKASAGEHRPQQEVMTRAVADAIAARQHLLVQAGTGTGKSLAYLFPAAASGKRTIVSTATNQLSEQLIGHDLPLVADLLHAAGRKSFTFALLKGRNNYLCKAKTAELENLDREADAHGHQDSLFTDDTPIESGSRKAVAKETGTLIAWGRETASGDRTEAPLTSDRAWAAVSTSALECPGADCPLFLTCFAELARTKARTADIVVTNQALLAQEVKAATLVDDANVATRGILGNWDVLIVDEAHELPNALTGALSADLQPTDLLKLITNVSHHVDGPTAGEEHPSVTAARLAIEALPDVLADLPEGPLPTLPAAVSGVLNLVATGLLDTGKAITIAVTEATGEGKPRRASALGLLAQSVQRAAEVVISARTQTAGTLRWVDRRDPLNPILRVAPLEVGEQLQAIIEDRTFIATSATLTVGNDFTPIQRTLGLEGTALTLDVGSPFQYEQQGMLYVPAAPFPEPVGKERTAHTAAVLDDVLALVTAAGGRTLALFTTTAGARRAADHLRTHLPGLTVHATGDMPAAALVRAFDEEETSVLCATMGLWQGVNVPGASCSLVIIDKVAFAPVDDVLTAARKALADERGQNGFDTVVVAQAATSLAQAAGRLIRVASDRGVVAILDPRLHTKRYGKILLDTLPPFPRFTNRDTVTAALTRLTGGLHPEARIPSATPKKPSPASPRSRTAAPRRSKSTKNLRPRRIE